MVCADAVAGSRIQLGVWRRSLKLMRISFTPSVVGLEADTNPLYRLVCGVQNYIHLPNPDPLYITLATVAGNMLTGSNIWMMLVGSSSSGKTLMLELLYNLMPDMEKQDWAKDDLHRLHIVGAIRSASALVSATARQQRAANSTGGLLYQVGSRGVLVCKDFTSMLALPGEVFSETVAGLRDTFDGMYTRNTGVDGGRTQTWKGRIGFLGAVTPEIDRVRKNIQEMGERWVYYRFDDSDGYGATMKALDMEDQQRDMELMRAMVEGFFVDLGLRFADNPRRELSEYEKNRLYTIASFATAARSSVPRDPYTGEIVDLASREAPPRLANELAQLYLGLEVIGVGDEGERWRIIGKVAFDSTKQLRARVLQDLWLAGEAGVGEHDIRKKYGVGRKSAAAVLEDLAIHKLVSLIERKVEKGGVQVFYEWAGVLTPHAKKMLDLGWKGEGYEEGEWNDEVSFEAYGA